MRLTISGKLDHGLLSAWQEAVARALKSPDLTLQLLQRETDLVPCFAEHYGKLKALPRKMRRGMQRQGKYSLAGIALLLALGQTQALAATINVDETTCALVNAITAANTDTAF
jgi:hypothetical protein